MNNNQLNIPQEHAQSVIDFVSNYKHGTGELNISTEDVMTHLSQHIPRESDVMNSLRERHHQSKFNTYNDLRSYFNDIGISGIPELESDFDMTGFDEEAMRKLIAGEEINNDDLNTKEPLPKPESLNNDNNEKISDESTPTPSDTSVTTDPHDELQNVLNNPSSTEDEINTAWDRALNDMFVPEHVFSEDEINKNIADKNNNNKEDNANDGQDINAKTNESISKNTNESSNNEANLNNNPINTDKDIKNAEMESEWLKSRTFNGTEAKNSLTDNEKQRRMAEQQAMQQQAMQQAQRGRPSGPGIMGAIGYLASSFFEKRNSTKRDTINYLINSKTIMLEQNRTKLIENINNIASGINKAGLPATDEEKLKMKSDTITMMRDYGNRLEEASDLVKNRSASPEDRKNLLNEMTSSIDVTKEVSKNDGNPEMEEIKGPAEALTKLIKKIIDAIFGRKHGKSIENNG